MQQQRLRFPHAQRAGGNGECSDQSVELGELRAVNSPARLWRDQGKFAARAVLLAPLCGQALALQGTIVA